MPRPPRYLNNLDLLDAVRAQLAADPDLSQAELRARVGGTQSVVSAAMRAVLVETGRLVLGDGVELDPRFAALIRVPEPPTPLDLRAAIASELAQPVADHLSGASTAMEAVIERVQLAALAAIDRERATALAMVDDANRRADRAEQFVDSLRREVSEAVAETERLRADAAKDDANQRLEIALLKRELGEMQTDRTRLEAVLREADADRNSARASLADARENAAKLDRELFAANVRLTDLERTTAELTDRLARAEHDLAAAREAEAESRASAAEARATAAARGEILQRVNRSPMPRRSKARPRT